MQPLPDIQKLTIKLKTHRGSTTLVKDLSLHVFPTKPLAL